MLTIQDNLGSIKTLRAKAIEQRVDVFYKEIVATGGTRVALASEKLGGLALPSS